MQKNLTRLALGALLTAGAALSGVAFSQAVEPVVAEISGSQLAGEVMVVNTETRLMTLKDADGVFHVLHVPPEVSRIDEIKIGDTVTITEISSALIGLTPADAGTPPTMDMTTDVDRDSGRKPSGGKIGTDPEVSPKNSFSNQRSANTSDAAGAGSKFRVSATH